MSKTPKNTASGRPPAKVFKQKLSSAALRRIGKPLENAQSHISPLSENEEQSSEEAQVVNKTPLNDRSKKVVRVTFGARIHPDIKARFFRLHRHEMNRRDENFPKGELLEEALELLFQSKKFN